MGKGESGSESRWGRESQWERVREGGRVKMVVRVD